MAVAGLLVHTEMGKAAEVEAGLTGIPGVSSQGVREDQYVVVVAEGPSNEMEAMEKRLDGLPGVLKVYTTYMNVEDELEAG